MTNNKKMKEIEVLLKSANSKIPKISKDFSDDLYKTILKKNIKIKPRFISIIIRIGSAIGSIFFILLAVLLLNAFVYETKMNGSLELLNFGNSFIGDFMWRLPIDLIVYTLFFIIGAIFLLRQNDILKRMAIMNLSLIVISLSGATGTVLANSGINENLQKLEVSGEINVPLMHSFYTDRAKYQLNHHNVILGEVTQITGNIAQIKTPDNKEFTVQLPKKLSVSKGQFIRLKGTKGNNSTFIAEMIQHCKSLDVDRYFSHHENMKGHHDQMINMM